MANHQANELQREWEARARSPQRDYFVASHPGWDHAPTWENHARVDTALLLSELDDGFLRRARVLEMGCGVGRLVPILLERVAEYTGFDIAKSMVEEAERRCADESRARFFVGDGRTIPDAALDREYDLVLCHAVFIHCPLEVITSLTHAAVRSLAPGGRFRFQLRADETDPTGIVAPPVALDAAEVNAVQLESAPVEAAEHLTHTYVGHAFRYDAVPALFPEWGELRLVRTDPMHVYGEWTR